VTKAAIQRFARYVTRHVAGFRSSGPLLALPPVRPILRAVYLNRSSSPGLYYLEVFVQPLYAPFDSVAFGIGWRLGGRAHTWNLSDVALWDSAVEAIRIDALPFLESVAEPLDVIRAAQLVRRTGPVAVRYWMALSYARAGETARALSDLDTVAVELRQSSLSPDLALQAEKMIALLRDDPSEARRQLDAWENYTFDKLGLAALE